MTRSSARSSAGRRNCLAACVSVFCSGILYCSFDIVPAGEDVAARSTPPEIPILNDSDPVPLPPEARDIAEDNSTPPAPSELVQLTEGGRLNSQEAIKFCVLLLRDGERLMEGVTDYTVQFHKEERVGGDLVPTQTIDMKIQHKPHFAVYMKWLTGEKGMQVLYSDDYEDGCLSLKFGGFKKLLPAMRLDPQCSQVRSKSRYPITEAGVLTMTRKLLKHREADLKNPEGVSCVRLENREFDGRECYCFRLEYDSQEQGDTYRKHCIMIDSQLHVPRIVQNYTWAADSEGLSDQELDKLTLIENYSFTNLNLSSKLVALDFSRDNPRYRM